MKALSRSCYGSTYDPEEDDGMKPLWIAGLVVLALATAGLVLVLATVWPRVVEPLIIPELEDVRSVIVSHVDGTSTIWMHEIKDPERIAPILAHLRERNSGYRKAMLRIFREVWSRETEHDHTIAFGKEDTTASLILWIGPDWLGGFDDRRKEGTLDERDRPMSASEREAILALVREPDPKGRVIIGNSR